MNYSLSDDYTLQNTTSSSSNLFSSSGGIGDTTHDTTFLGIDSSLNSNALDTNSDDDEDDGTLLGMKDGKDEGLLEKLTRAWVDERNAPEVLKWEEDVVEGLLVRLNAQVSFRSVFPTSSSPFNISEIAHFIMTHVNAYKLAAWFRLFILTLRFPLVPPRLYESFLP